MRTTTKKYLGASLLCAQLFASGCGDEDNGGPASLSVVLEPEDTIIAGLAPGQGAENIRDGWTVGFDQYLAAVGPIRLISVSNPAVVVDAPEVHIVDLKQVPAGGTPLWRVVAPTEGAYQFRYFTPTAKAGAVAQPNVPAADAQKMIANQWTYFIRGVLAKADGQSCPPVALANPGTKQSNGQLSGGNPCYAAPTIRFEFGAAAPTEFGPCEVDGIPGVTLASNQEKIVAATIHGDHLFFNGFPEGDEGGVFRFAQWLADCDLNLDGTVTAQELMAIAPTQLPQIDARYQLGGSPITPLTTMYQFVQAQLKTQGHFQGEGECPVDGKAHDHGHGHGGHGGHEGHGH